MCTVPQDMRRSFDGLALATRQILGENPEGGALFVFVNKTKTRAKVLWFEPSGYCLLSKRLHRAVFAIPMGAGPSLRIDANTLATFLGGVPRKRMRKKLDS